MRRLCVALCLSLATIVAGVGPTQPSHATTLVGPKAYYLALGDSLAYGYQPNLVFNQGYADDFYANLKTHGTSHFTNMGCPDESSSTFINGGCPYWWMRKTLYTGSQLSAAQSFIKSHSGQVSPVTLDIGANDVLPLINPTTCAVDPSWQTALNTFSANFTSILQKLKTSLNGKGDLLVMDYYDPYQNQCSSNPVVLSDLETMNSTIAADAAGAGALVAPVFNSFGGATTPNPNICTDTWMCSTYNDIHATATGYSVIAQAFEGTAGY